MKMVAKSNEREQSHPGERQLSSSSADRSLFSVRHRKGKHLSGNKQHVKTSRDVDIASTDSGLFETEETLSEASSESSNPGEQINNKQSSDRAKDLDDDYNELSPSSSNSSFFHRDKPLTLNVEFNVVAWTLFIVAFGMRLWRLEHPRSIVFDELHYGRFISFYIKGIFFFDSQPPLGKQLVAATAYLAGYNGENNFTAIGADYADTVPLKALRALPALFGALLVPTVYHFVVELGLTHRTAAITSLFVILENSLLTQSRFILMDSIQIFFSMFGLFALLKCRREQVFSVSWFAWLFASASFLSLGICVKYSGFYSLILAITIALYDFWWLIPDRTIAAAKLWVQFLIYVLHFIVLPVAVYIFVFYVHLSWLTRAGPHDNILTSAFQASLEGGLASITKGQPTEIVHGSQITLRHTHGRTCWLHSHPPVYPVRYADNRGSSHQQQVTCYSFKDVNNWWIVKKPEVSELVVTEPLQRIKDGDVIQLIHGITGRSLNSHDVAAAMSPANQEVSCYVDYNISMPSQNLWKVSLLNAEETGGIWHTIRSEINLIHFNSSQALKFSGKQLPDWGFNQHEIVTDRVVNQDDTVWNVEEHRYTSSSDEKQRERELVSAEFVPLSPTQLNFWEKMKELQYKMLIGSNDKIEGHMYENDSPLAWLTLSQGIAYWVASDSNSQIHLVGNIVLWFTGLLGILVFLTLFAVYLLRRRRKFHDIPEPLWERLTLVLRVCFVGYLVNFVPYFFMERSLFLHQYLPSLVFKIILLAALLEFIEVIAVRHRSVVRIVYLVLLMAFAHCFLSLAPLSYGSGALSARDIERIKWRRSWHLIVHKD